MLSTDPNAKQKIEDAISYYESIAQMPPAQLVDLWEEETEEQFEEMLGCVPPLVWRDYAFMVGECTTHSKYGAIYDAHIKADGKFYWRPAYAQTFDPENYRAEIKNKFNKEN